MASSDVVHARASASSQAADPAREALERAGVLARLAELQRITEGLFPGEVSYSLETDPELPDEHYAVFDVTAPNSYPEISRRRREWFERTYDVLRDDCDKVRLSVSVIE